MTLATHLQRLIPTELAALAPWQQVILILAVSVVMAKVLESVGFNTLDHYTDISRTDLDDLFIKLVRVPLYVTILLGGVYYSVHVIDPGTVGVYIQRTALTLVVLFWARAIFTYGNEAVDVVQNEEVAQDIAPFVSNVVSVIVIAASALLLLTLWNIDITPFLASAGIIGIVIGFAAREALADFIGGIALYVDDTYRVGDVIQLEDGQRGTVSNVGIRSTRVITRDNVQVNVPNSVLNDARVINQSAPQHRQRIRIPISVEYGADLEQVDRIIESVCEETDDILNSPEPTIYLLEFGDSALNYELRVYTAHPFDEYRIRNAVNRRIYERFEAAGIGIPFPQRTISHAED